MAALGENGQLFRGKRCMEPDQILVRQEKIVLINNDANVWIGTQAGIIRPQITRFLQRFRRIRGQSMTLIIRDRKFLKIILKRILEDLPINRGASPLTDRVLQDALIITLLTAVNNVPQYESKRQPDEKLGFDGVEGERRLGRESAPA